MALVPISEMQKQWYGRLAEVHGKIYHLFMMTFFFSVGVI